MLLLTGGLDILRVNKHQHTMYIIMRVVRKTKLITDEVG